MNNKVLIAIAIIGGIISIAEKMLFSESQFYVGSYITVTMIFICCLRHRESVNKKVEFIGKSLSMYIYVIHVAVIKLIGLWAESVDIADKNLYLWCRPLAVIFASIAGAGVAYLIGKRGSFSASVG